MARCGCGTDCQCTVQAGSCTTVTGSGSSATPYTISVDLSAVAGNTLSCVADGLYGSAGGLTVSDTSCINLGGDGSSGTPLTAAPIFSSDAGNVLECRGDGLYAPAAGTSGATNYALFEDNNTNPTILPADGTGHSSIEIDFDTVISSAGINAYTAGTGPDHTFAYAEITAAGFYFVNACVQGWGVGPVYSSDATASTVIKYQPGGPPAAEVRLFWATVPWNSTTGYDNPGNAPFVHVSGIQQFAAGDQVWAKFAFDDWKGAAFAGATIAGSSPVSAWFQVWRIGV